MMMESGPEIFGLHLGAFLMLASGIFYLICAAFLFRPWRQEKNELIGALFAFLVYQAVSMFFMGLEIQTMNMNYMLVAALGVFIGSVYMLKFPFSSFSEKKRRGIFMLSLIIVLAIFIWFIQTPEREMALESFILWYDLVVNGLIVGGFILALGLKTSLSWLRIKAFGGGSGVVTCCVVSNAAMIGGAFLTSSIFQFLAPIIILGSLAVARKKQNEVTGGVEASH